MSISVVYEDDWFLVVNKPAGLLTIPTPKKETRTLTSILQLHPCHRLDRETSGLIIYAKSKSAQKKMMHIFKEKKVKKAYVAFVHGALPDKAGSINYPVDGRMSTTQYKVLERRKDFSIVEVSPLTGRKNQIRIHFKRIGHPVVGESKFAFRKDFKLRAKRLCLHAAELEFTHPLTNQPVILVSDLPQDMINFLEKHP